LSYFDTKAGKVYIPENPSLYSLYRILEKYAPALEGSPFFNALVEAYETLDSDLDDGIYEE
jgi:hypothetical protein